jgi:hypothetical protein
MHVGDRAGVREAVEQDRAGDVVGQIARHPQFAASRKRGQVHLQYVGMDDFEFTHARRTRAQRFDQIGVQLDRGQMSGRLEQRQRERALAGTDFDDAIVRARRDCRDDAFDHPALVQEVLAEMLFGRRQEQEPFDADRRGWTRMNRRAECWRRKPWRPFEQMESDKAFLLYRILSASIRVKCL